MLRRLIFAAAICLASFQARASIVWRGDFETDDLSQWDKVDGLTSRLTVVKSPLRQGSYALRVELRSGDVASNGNRNELVRTVPETEGMDRYYAWSTMFDASYPIANTWQVFTQWHHSGCCGSPPLEFDVDGQTLSLSRNPPDNTGTVAIWSTPLVRGVWHDFVLHVIWSSSADKGFIELWYDGQKVIEGKSVQTLFPNMVNYLKQGLYRDSSIAATGVVYHDGMTMGTTLADVAPQLVPPPPDAGTGPDAGAEPTPGQPASVPAARAGIGFPNQGCTSAGSITGIVIAAFALLRPKGRGGRAGRSAPAR
ncbi:MAG TPA: polysaccharide lyase [Myxococcales bacterium]|nr:polysaccharide lyase [Myxococcales bacterium]